MASPARSPTPSSTRATCSTPTAPRRGRTRCAGSSACSVPPGYAAAGPVGGRRDRQAECLLEPRATTAAARPAAVPAAAAAAGASRPMATGGARVWRRGASEHEVDEAVELARLCSRRRDRTAAAGRRAASGVERGRRTSPGGAGRSHRRLVAAAAPRWPDGARDGAGQAHGVEVRRHRPSGTGRSAGRGTALRHVAGRRAHLLVGDRRGRFVSLLDPPEWARPGRRGLPTTSAPGRCSSATAERPRRRAVVADHPLRPPASRRRRARATCSTRTEIDEILTLRVMTLTDEEKAEARATDPRAAAVIDRGRRDAAGDAGAAARRDPLTCGPRRRPARRRRTDDAGLEPERALVGSRRGRLGRSRRPTRDRRRASPVAKGSRVLPAAGPRRADAQDMFLAGRTATVAGGAVRRRRRPRTWPCHPRRRPGRRPAASRTAASSTSAPTRSSRCGAA